MGWDAPAHDLDAAAGDHAAIDAGDQEHDAEPAPGADAALASVDASSNGPEHDVDASAGDADAAARGDAGAPIDCTGPDLSEPKLPSERVFTQPGGGPYNRTVTLLPRGSDGAWLLYSGAADDYGNNIVFQRLDVNGLPDGRVESPATVNTAGFAAATSGKWSAILARMRPGEGQTQNGSETLSLQLYRAADMSLVKEQILVENVDDDALAGDADDLDDCDSVRPVKLSILEDALGRVRVAAAFLNSIGKANGSGGCTAQTGLAVGVSSFSSDGTWQPLRVQGLPASGVVSLDRAPCNDNSWLMTFRDSTTAYTRRLSIEGDLSVDDIIASDASHYITSIDSDLTSCEGDKGLSHVVYYEYTTVRTTAFLRRWETDLMSGVVSRLGTDIELYNNHVTSSHVVQANGHLVVGGWFAGKTHDPLPRLFAVTPGADTPVTTIPVVSNPGANPGTHGASSGLVHTGRALVAAFAGAGGNNLDERRAPGDTDPAIAVTYTYGCE